MRHAATRRCAVPSWSTAGASATARASEPRPSRPPRPRGSGSRSPGRAIAAALAVDVRPPVLRGELLHEVDALDDVVDADAVDDDPVLGGPLGDVRPYV